MRIFTLHSLARAFPELDRYSKEQRERFFVSAKGSWWRRSARWGVVLVAYVVSLGIFYGLFLGAMWLSAPNHEIDRFDPRRSAFYIFLASGILALILPFFVALLTRDILLHRRVRYVLRDRGRCTGCGYVLIGLFVAEGARVTCPECGVITEVDPSLGDLVLEGPGGARYQPSAHGVAPPRFLTPGRVRFLKRTIVVFAIGLPLLVGGWIGVREILLERQAARAVAMKPNAEGILAHVEKAQPVPASHDEPEAHAVLSKLVVERANIEARFNRDRKAQIDPDPQIEAYPDSVYSKPRKNADEEEIEKSRRERVLARALMEDFNASPTFNAMMDELAACRRNAMPVNMPPGQPAINVLLPELGQMRMLARVNAARMALAQERGDTEEWVRAFEANLALARMGLSQFTLIQGLVGVAIDALTHTRLKALLRDHPGDDVLDAIEQALARQSLPHFAHSVEGERIAIHDTLTWYFSDVKRVRWGRFSRDISQFFGSRHDIRKGLGWLSTNLREFDQVFDRAALVTDSTPAQIRKNPKLLQHQESDMLLIDMLTPAMHNAAQSSWCQVTERRGAAIMIALERYRNAKGEYPPALDALVPGFLPRQPLDPFSDEPYLYMRLDKPDDNGRGYLLYSVGTDGDDDGGTLIKGDRYSQIKLQWPTDMNGDFIINDSQD